jgi:hypothetical protein
MTAIIGKKCKDGILIMADKRITYRETQEVYDNEKKIFVLNKRLLLAYAGVKNIIDIGLDELQHYAHSTNSLEDIINHSQKIFRSALNLFKQTHPTQGYATVYVLAGFNDHNETFVFYFSSDDDFQKRYPLEFFYKTFPNTETSNLRAYLTNEVDCSQHDVNYFLQKFSSAIRRINHEMVGNTTYSIFLSREEVWEIDINENGDPHFKKIVN